MVSSRRTVTRTVRRSSGDGERVVTTTRTETSSSGADEDDDDSSSSSSVGFFGFLFFVMYVVTLPWFARHRQLMVNAHTRVYCNAPPPAPPTSYIALSVVAYAALFAGLTMCLATFSPESYSTAALSYDAAVRLVFADDAATQLVRFQCDFPWCSLLLTAAAALPAHALVVELVQLQAVDIIYAAGIVGGLTGLLLGMRNVKFMASAYD